MYATITKNEIIKGTIIRNPYDKDQSLEVIDTGEHWCWCKTLYGDPDPSKWRIEYDMIDKIVNNLK